MSPLSVPSATVRRQRKRKATRTIPAAAKASSRDRALLESRTRQASKAAQCKPMSWLTTSTQYTWSSSRALQICTVEGELNCFFSAVVKGAVRVEDEISQLQTGLKSYSVLAWWSGFQSILFHHMHPRRHWFQHNFLLHETWSFHLVQRCHHNNCLLPCGSATGDTPLLPPYRIQWFGFPDSWSVVGWGDGEGAPIHMPMIRLETVENHRMYCLMPSDNFILKKSGTQAGIEPTTFAW